MPLFCTSCRLDIQPSCRKFVEQNRENLNDPIDARVTSQQVELLRVHGSRGKSYGA